MQHHTTTAARRETDRADEEPVETTQVHRTTWDPVATRWLKEFLEHILGEDPRLFRRAVRIAATAAEMAVDLHLTDRDVSRVVVTSLLNEITGTWEGARMQHPVAAVRAALPDPPSSSPEHLAFAQDIMDRLLGHNRFAYGTAPYGATNTTVTMDPYIIGLATRMDRELRAATEGKNTADGVLIAALRNKRVDYPNSVVRSGLAVLKRRFAAAEARA